MQSTSPMILKGRNTLIFENKAALNDLPQPKPQTVPDFLFLLA
jgi:hypothetical protein